MALTNNKNSATRVLVVDDQPITRALLSRAISSQGFTVDSANNGEEALGMWLDQQHSLVITDCHMPIKDGYTFTQDIRLFEQTEHLKPIRIIAWSANAEQEEQEKCFQAGMDDFLKKPINLDQLNQILSTFTSASESDVIEENVMTLEQDKQSPIDYSILNQIVPDPRKQFKIINDLLDYLNKDYPTLRQYAKVQQLTDLKNTAHRLKGACKMVGANNIADVFAVIEKDVLRTRTADTERLLDKLKGAINQLEYFINNNEAFEKVNPHASALNHDQ